METTSLVTQSSSQVYDHQQVAKNKRKKFNPQYMLTNSSSDDDEGGGSMTKDDDDDDDDRDMNGGKIAEMNNSTDNSDAIIQQSTNFTKQDYSPNSVAQSSIFNSFLSPSKMSILQSFQQQQQQIIQQAALSAIAPQLSQQINNSSTTNFSETESKLREFAYKTMQELLNVYGLSLPTNDLLESMKNQQMNSNSSNSGSSGLEPPTPPRTPIISSQKINEKNFNNNNEDSKENYGGNSSSFLRNSRDLSNHKSIKSESDFESSSRRSSHFHDDSEDGRESVVSGTNINGNDDDSDHEESDFSSFEKISMKNIENFLDKSSLQNFYNPMMQVSGSHNDKSEKKLIAEYSKYLTKYQSYTECRDEKCASENQREHYHCYDIQCYNKVLNKKEEIIRHLKWHKKRAESLSHGFLRFTSSDDCTIQYGYCQHNRKQTHYHCIQNKCDKVYISTSDVQMHSNYHRKDSAIYQEGFQRYRATEKCLVQHCIFYGQCTTHFHCRRCKYTFKNKADMEKHKTYHMKDEQLLKDGFKKFLKTEPCCVEGCRFTMICNHIHCIRSGCTYVLHSSGQLLSHKRKHERVDAEMAYRRFKMGQTAKDLTPSELAALQSFHGLDLAPKTSPPLPVNQFPVADQATTEKFNKLLNNATMENLNALLSHTSGENENVSSDILKEVHEQIKTKANMEPQQDSFNESDNSEYFDESMSKSLLPNMLTGDEIKSPTVEEVEQIISQYFTDLCSKQTNQQEQPLDLNMKSSNKSILECFMSNNESHLHCLITGCEAVVPRNLKDISEHLRMHELNRGADSIIQNSNLLQITSIDGFFNRKRGRPPKNRVVEVYNNTHHPPQAIFTSFKLEKNDNKSNSSGQQNSKESTKNKIENTMAAKFASCKVRVFQPTESCPDSSCVFKRITHYHCNLTKVCHYSTNHLTQMDQHLNEFHKKIDILENYEHYDRNYDCKKGDCCHNKISPHYHCILCKFSFSMASEMAEHVCEKDIEENYENFDMIESDILAARSSQPNQIIKQEQNYSFDNRSMSEKLQEKFNSIEHKVALNSDVDLIKTSRLPYSVKQENKEDDKVSVVRASGTWMPLNTENTEHSKPSNHYDSSRSSPSDDSCCDRPFCKLKKKQHQHCELCNQGFTDSMKLKLHYLKHRQSKLSDISSDEKFDQNSESADENEPHDLSKNNSPTKSSSISNFLAGLQGQSSSSNLPDNLQFPNLQLANLAQLYQQSPLYYPNLYPFLNNPGLQGIGMDQLSPLMQFPFPVAAAMLQSNSSPNFDFGMGMNSLLNTKRKLENGDDLQMSKKSKMSERPKEYQKKTYKDDSVPTGYLKFRFNQDCNFSNCGYRNHQSHFHCCRKDCFYSFCDKTRFVQHTARHERLDKLMGDDFKQFRANMHCGYDNCVYNKNIGPHNKSSHFHCLRMGCNYICSDTNKVVAHRRQHTKQEFIKLAGFRKYSSNDHCNIQDPHTPDGECPYTLKQSHYHCLVCQMGVLSRNQLSFHNHRIRPGMSLNDSLSQIDPKLANEQGLVILNDNGSDDNSC